MQFQKGNNIDVINKIEFASHQTKQNNVRIQLMRNNDAQIQNNNGSNNMEIKNNPEINIYYINYKN